MGIFSPPRYSFFTSLLLFCCWLGVFFCLAFVAVAQKPSFSFSFEGFEKTPVFDAELALFGDAEVVESKVRMTPTPTSRSGGVIYRKPIDFGRKPSFSTDFSFSISPDKGNGLAFLIAPGNFPKESLGEHMFGLSPGVFAVELDTSVYSGTNGLSGNRIGINIGSNVSIETFNVSAIKLVLNSGEKLHCWIDFDGDLKFLEVRLNKSGSPRPSDPFVSYPIDLSGIIWQNAMFVGIISSSGNSTQISAVHSWSFRLKHARPYLMHSEPLDPGPFTKPLDQPILHIRSDSLPRILMALAFGAACGAAVAFLVLFVWSAAVDRRPVAPVEFPPHPMEFEYEKINSVKKVVT